MKHLTEAELQAWIDREIDPAEHARVNGHLEGCSACRNDLQALERAAETFSAAMLAHDEAIAAESGAAASAMPPPPVRRGTGVVARTLPRWVGRAAALVLLLGAAAAAAMVPGSPLRGLFVDEEPAAGSTPEIAAPTVAVPAPGTSITVAPDEGRLTVRIRDFTPGTRLSVALNDREVAVASLPDGAPDARFIVASGVLDVIGPGASAEGSTPAGTVTLRLPRSLADGVVELDGEVVARVGDGRLNTLRQASSRGGGEEAVFEVGG